MLVEAGVPVLFERCLETVEMKDGRLVSATMETGTLRAKLESGGQILKGP